MLSPFSARLSLSRLSACVCVPSKRNFASSNSICEMVISQNVLQCLSKCFSFCLDESNIFDATMCAAVDITMCSAPNSNTYSLKTQTYSLSANEIIN